MFSKRCVLAITLLLVTGGVARAGVFDVIQTVGNVADTVADTQRSLAEGRLPSVAINGGGHSGKAHGGGGKHAGGGGGHHKK